MLLIIVTISIITAIGKWLGLRDHKLRHVPSLPDSDGNRHRLCPSHAHLLTVLALVLGLHKHHHPWDPLERPTSERDAAPAPVLTLTASF